MVSRDESGSTSREGMETHVQAAIGNPFHSRRRKYEVFGREGRGKLPFYEGCDVGRVEAGCHGGDWSDRRVEIV